MQMRARAAAREPGERRLDALEGELERVRRDRSDLATDLAKAKASIAASEQQVRSFPAAMHNADDAAAADCCATSSQ